MLADRLSKCPGSYGQQNPQHFQYGVSLHAPDLFVLKISSAICFPQRPSMHRRCEGSAWLILCSFLSPLPQNVAVIRKCRDRPAC
jgi:hypothetical protein